MNTNQHEDEEEDCSICNESLPKLTEFIRMTCCGKGFHIKCCNDFLASSLSDKHKGQCPLCHTKHAATGSKEEIEQLLPLSALVND